jgi:hypothetical protein
MPISINKNSINFGTYSISVHPDGIEIDGKFKYGSYATPPPPPVFQGTTAGYTAGGYSYPVRYQKIDKYSFASDGNATNLGNLLTTAKSNAVGCVNFDIAGYVAGGKEPPNTTTNDIEKFLFASEGATTDVGDLTTLAVNASGASSSQSGYTAGGHEPATTTIDKFPFASDANATDVGDLLTGGNYSVGQSSTTNGYSSGVVPSSNTIEKYPFATDANATDVGDLTQARFRGAGSSSSESGYTAGGNPRVDTIDKFPFATDANATDVGNLTQGAYGPTGTSSTISGYRSGGNGNGPFADVNIIDKFPFAADANATDVGNLTSANKYQAGVQD